jgi:hypothetical protein
LNSKTVSKADETILLSEAPALSRNKKWKFLFQQLALQKCFTAFTNDSLKQFKTV